MSAHDEVKDVLARHAGRITVNDNDLDLDWRSFEELVRLGVTRGWLDNQIQQLQAYGLLWIIFQPDQWNEQMVATVQLFTGSAVEWVPGQPLYCWGRMRDVWERSRAEETVEMLNNWR